MKDRFNLEQDLMNFSQIIEELDMLHEKYIDGPKPMTEDEVSNYIFALQQMCKLRYDRVWDTFCQAFELDDYSPARKSKPWDIEPWDQEEEEEEPVKTADNDTVLLNIELALNCVKDERYATAEVMLRDTIRLLKV